MEKKQKLLAPMHEKVRKEQQALELAISSRDLLKTKEASSSKELSAILERIEEIEEELQLARGDKERLEEEAERLETGLGNLESQVEQSENQIIALQKDIDLMNSTLAEARESLSLFASGGAILQAILKEKRSGRICGIHVQ